MTQTIQVHTCVSDYIYISKVWLTKNSKTLQSQLMIQNITINCMYCQLIHNSKSIITNKHNFKTIYRGIHLFHILYMLLIFMHVFCIKFIFKVDLRLFLRCHTLFITILLHCRIKQLCTCDYRPTNFIVSSFRIMLRCPRAKIRLKNNIL